MRAKLMTSAALLAGVLAFATASYADPRRDDDGGTSHSHNDNSHTTDSYNDNSHTTDSNNDNSTNTDNSHYTDMDLDVDDSFNDNSKIEHSYNTNDSYNATDSYNTDNSVNDSFNDNSSHDTWNVRVSLNYQDLYASVSGVGFDQSEDNDGGQHGHITSGDISQSGGAFAGFAGIQTVSNNTGMGSIGQAATAVSANANVTFGNGGGGN